MDPSTITIRPLDPKAATAAEWQAIHTLANRIRAERSPDDPPETLEDIAGWYRHAPPSAGLRVWVAWRGGEAVGRVTAWLNKGTGNEHMAWLEGEVLPEWRRQGLGRRLLGTAAAAAQADNRTLVILETVSTIPAGAAFAARLGAEVGLETHTNLLALADLDPRLLAAWLAPDPARAGFELIGWDGPTPEEYLADMAALVNGVDNLSPRGTLQVEDEQVTPAHVREWEQTNAALGHIVWTLMVREPRQDWRLGAVAGYTGVRWNPRQPTILRQQGTIVWPQYQGHGLGRWLKAAMLDRVLRERPAVRFVRTDNADANAPMLKINTDLGFRPYLAASVWQVPLERVLAHTDETRET